MWDRGAGNLEAKRDWGYAKDYVEAMWLMQKLAELMTDHDIELARRDKVLLDAA